MDGNLVFILVAMTIFLPVAVLFLAASVFWAASVLLDLTQVGARFNGR